ncbi:MAG: HAD family hydrolase [Spirochaetota bacterium]
MSTVVFGRRVFEPQLIIFDKDGTLTDFRKTWFPLFNKRIEIVLNNLEEDMPWKNSPKKPLPWDRILSAIYRAYGIDNHYIDPHGPFPYSTPWEDEIIMATVLYRFGVGWQKAKDTVHHAIDIAEKNIDRVKLTALYPDVKMVLEDLHRREIMLSVASADLSEIVVQTLKQAGVYDLFDYVIGADMVKHDKPHPEMIDKTISTLDADRKKTVMVGDSITDMEMGKRAGVGLVVGVLESEVAARADLEKDADVVIDSVRDIRVI